MFDAYAPGGAAVSTAKDLALLATALLNGTAPGMTALTPTAPTDQGNTTVVGMDLRNEPHTPAGLTYAQGATWGTGDPNTDGGPAWPAYDGTRRSTMVFGADTHVEDAPYDEERQLWQAATRA